MSGEQIREDAISGFYVKLLIDKQMDKWWIKYTLLGKGNKNSTRD